MTMDIELFPCHDDNFGVLIRDSASGAVAAIDAPEEGAIRAALARRGWGLDLILITHHHHDHIEAAPALCAAFGAALVAPARSRAVLPRAERYVDEGERVTLGQLAAEVWHTPGHCADHVAYYFAAEKVIFVGDTLFPMGCGRIFDATPGQLFATLGRMAALPEETRVYSGHEYTLGNARFCAAIEPENAEIAARLAAVSAARARGEFTLPTTIGEERRTNVFLRARDVAQFAARREAKNSFRG